MKTETSALVPTSRRHELCFSRAGIMLEFAMASSSPHGPLRVGIGGPVGSGKTALMEHLCKRLREHYDLAAITNDIYTKEDAEILARAQALSLDRSWGWRPAGALTPRSARIAPSTSPPSRK